MTVEHPFGNESYSSGIRAYNERVLGVSVLVYHVNSPYVSVQVVVNVMHSYARCGYLALVILWPTVDAMAWASYRGRLPSQQFSCGTCHQNNRGGAPRNGFGWDFVRSNRRWSPELCALDSDMDGFSNAVELGDRDCDGTSLGVVYNPGDAGSRPPSPPSAGASGPGVGGAPEADGVGEPAPPMAGEPAPPMAGESAPPLSGEPAPPLSGEPAPPLSGEPVPPMAAGGESAPPRYAGGEPDEARQAERFTAGADASQYAGESGAPVGGQRAVRPCDDFYYRTCWDDRDCRREGYRCGEMIDDCVPSTCDCHPDTGLPETCSRTCLHGVGLCEPIEMEQIGGREAPPSGLAGGSLNAAISAGSSSGEREHVTSSAGAQLVQGGVSSIQDSIAMESVLGGSLTHGEHGGRIDDDSEDAPRGNTMVPSMPTMSTTAGDDTADLANLSASGHSATGASAVRGTGCSTAPLSRGGVLSILDLVWVFLTCLCALFLRIIRSTPQIER